METDKRILEVMRKLEETSDPFALYDVTAEFRKYKAEHPEERAAVAEILLPEEMAFSLWQGEQRNKDAYAYG